MPIGILESIGHPMMPASTTFRATVMALCNRVVEDTEEKSQSTISPFDNYISQSHRLFIVRPPKFLAELLTQHHWNKDAQVYQRSTFKPSFTSTCYYHVMSRGRSGRFIHMLEYNLGYESKHIDRSFVDTWGDIVRTIPSFRVCTEKAITTAIEEWKSRAAYCHHNLDGSRTLRELTKENDNKRRRRYTCL